MIYAIDPYSAIQRKGNYMVLKAPDYIFSTFKGLMVWVKDKDSKINTGKLVSLPDFEEGFNDFRERIKVKIELTCATGYVDDKIFPKIINGMKFDGLCFMYDYSDDNKFEEVKKLFKLTKNALSMNKIKDFQILILANKKDLVNSSSKKPKLENSNFISIKENQDEFNLIFEKFINELLIKSDKIKNLINIELE